MSSSLSAHKTKKRSKASGVNLLVIEDGDGGRGLREVFKETRESDRDELFGVGVLESISGKGRRKRIEPEQAQAVRTTVQLQS